MKTNLWTKLGMTRYQYTLMVDAAIHRSCIALRESHTAALEQLESNNIISDADQEIVKAVYDRAIAVLHEKGMA
jgi:ABC-type uncharacterized transport system ATPase component